MSKFCKKKGVVFDENPDALLKYQNKQKVLGKRYLQTTQTRKQLDSKYCRRFCQLYDWQALQ